MYIRPIELRDANEFVEQIHRHHDPVQGHRWSVCAKIGGGKIVGVAICGRPVCKEYNPILTLEITRLCTDGTRNACSFLYGAVIRQAREHGFIDVQTYTLISEDGASLKASGFYLERITSGGVWTGEFSDGKKRKNTHPTGRKKLWRKLLR